MNYTKTEMKTTLEGINSRINEAEEWISHLEERMVEFMAAEQYKEKRMKRNEDSLRDLWDNMKRNNIHIIRVTEGEEREKGPEKLFEEIIIEIFPNMGKEIATNPGGAVSPIQDKPKEKLGETHSNQSGKN